MWCYRLTLLLGCADFGWIKVSPRPVSRTCVVGVGLPRLGLSQYQASEHAVLAPPVCAYWSNSISSYVAFTRPVFSSPDSGQARRDTAKEIANAMGCFSIDNLAVEVKYRGYNILCMILLA